MLEATPPPANQLIVREEVQQMIPHETSTYTTPSEGAQQMVPVHSTSQDIASEGAICPNKPKKIVTLADATTP